MVLVGGGGAVAFMLLRRVEAFTLRLELKTPQGERALRVAGREVIIDETPRTGPPTSTNCELGLGDALKLHGLSRAQLLERSADEKRLAGTFMTSVGDDDALGNGNVDVEQAAVLSDFIVKHSSGCVKTP